MKSVYGCVNLYESKNRMKPCHCYAAARPMADWWKREKENTDGKTVKVKINRCSCKYGRQQAENPGAGGKGGGAGRSEGMPDPCPDQRPGTGGRGGDHRRRGCGKRRGGLGLFGFGVRRSLDRGKELWKASAGNHAAGPSCAAGFLGLAFAFCHRSLHGAGGGQDRNSGYGYVPESMGFWKREWLEENAFMEIDGKSRLMLFDGDTRVGDRPEAQKGNCYTVRGAGLGL